MKIDRKTALTAARLREVLDYNPETGEFTWRRRVGGHSLKGKSAGCIVPCGYVRISVCKSRHYAQQLAWLYVHGTWPVSTIDHINGVKTDNRIANLREALHNENCQNQKKAHSQNIAGILGVSQRRGDRYYAEIRVSGKRKYLGCYATPEEAQAAYLRAKQELHPFGTLDEADADANRLLKLNKTGLLGVEVRQSGKFASRIKLDGERVYLGLFDTAEAAHEAYMKAKAEHCSRKMGGK